MLLEVYDMLGRRVATLADGTRTVGYHNVTWTASGLTSGTYLLKLVFVGPDGKTVSQSKRMVLAR